MNRFLVWIFLMHPVMCLGEEPDNITEHSNWQLLNSDQCGISNSDRIIGGVEAPLGAYPWLARIGYTIPASPNFFFSCAGAIINKLYVITAAHCVVNLPENMTPVLVRLGEHNLDTNPDCKDSFCNDPYQDRFVDEIIPHENYNPGNSKNDITLLRVKEITFTEFVRPICMVKGILLEKDFSGKIVEVAGWGVYDIVDLKSSTTLQSVKLPVLQISECIQNSFYGNYSIDSNQMCVGGKAGKDSCKGDSGGPLMKIESGGEGDSPRYYVIGIVSFGPNQCGALDLPGIYTNVSKYILWILDHLRN